jgi:hypothetical protein
MHILMQIIPLTLQFLIFYRLLRLSLTFRVLVDLMTTLLNFIYSFQKFVQLIRSFSFLVSGIHKISSLGCCFQEEIGFCKNFRYLSCFCEDQNKLLYHSSLKLLEYVLHIHRLLDFISNLYLLNYFQSFLSNHKLQ